ncbi:SDR family oxidoreductase [Amycolatopsis jiangsuensis]|uniref:NAD(P)-dependent dehydrogenase (Short-subunit alcohol dehydrogenase family) n=1 Tax=Amycolatopsis jiangsuensis TaxID=1181879 RepID=A0A840J7B4_9PSEU|nr:SDR family oxidoreductase [Amycolatopsis jiangsuensis]MBB4689673.1 NAD(P)-dependent dehydrogenase (short-subunit alcohol dehydrogenase family) [Amycolatopsis jiangsuensis]
MTRRILVTGAAGGFGTIISRELLRRGFRVALVDRDEHRLTSVSADLASATGGEALAAAADLADPAARARAVSEVDAAWGGVDGIVNSAGVGPGIVRPDFVTRPILAEEVTEEHLRRSWETNTLAPTLLAMELLPRMRARGWGRIVNVTTGLGTMLRLGFLTYGPSKAAFEAATAILAEECKGTGVTVNVVVPGGTADTPMVPAQSRSGDVRLINPEVMADPVAFLLSEDAGTANGVRIVAADWNPDARPDPAALAPVGW